MGHDLTQPLTSLPDPLPIPTIAPGAKPFDVVIRPPGSKSITNRALLLAALADGVSTLRGPLIDADDARVMIRALEQLGVQIQVERGAIASSELDILRITGVAGRWKIPPGQTVTLNLNNAGTATRFLTAAAILAPPGTSIIIDGDARMRERPIRELVDLLRAIGVRVEYRGREGFPPVAVHAPAELAALQPRHRLGTTASSQFISAIMLVAPFLPRGIDLELALPVTSMPYIGMSAKLLDQVIPGKHFMGWAKLGRHADQALTIRVPSHGEPHLPPMLHTDPAYSTPCPATPLPAFNIDIEPDASGATYFIAAALLVPGSRVTIDGIDGSNSAQGDTRFAPLLKGSGMDFDIRTVKAEGGRAAAFTITGPAHLHSIDADLSDMPDTAMTAAVLACFAEGPSTLRGLRTLRVKETDRLAALQTELTKLGAKVEIIADNGNESIRITPSLHPFVPRTLLFHTYNDHRMAMALALVGLRVPGIRVQNPACVAKTYPRFWSDFATIIAPHSPRAGS